MSIRSLAERLTGPLVLRRRLPSNFGANRLFVTTQSGGLKYLRRDLSRTDPFLLAVVDEFVKPGTTVWDIGANVGLFTFAAASRVTPSGSVLSVDADIDNVRLLLRSRAALDPNRNGRVDVLSVAVADSQTPFVTFQIARRARASNAIAGFGQSQTGGVAETRTVPAYTLDQLLDSFPNPRFVKIDIEGAEIIALRGAERLLSQCRPTFCIEVGQENQAHVSEIFKRHRYRFYDAEAPRDRRPELPLVPWNALVIPD